jgi:hypothetical protein
VSGKADDDGGGRKGRGSTKLRRPGLPDSDKVVAESELLSPRGLRYRVLRTCERDGYEEDCE